VGEISPYSYIDGIYLKCSRGSSYENVAITVSIGANVDGYRKIIGRAKELTESKDSWKEFLAWLKESVLKGAYMLTDDKSIGMLEAIEETFPQVRYRRCSVHFYRDVFSQISTNKRVYIAKMHESYTRPKSLRHR
jgi:transposase-like protein